jgi:hypothetical protein
MMELPLSVHDRHHITLTRLVHVLAAAAKRGSRRIADPYL